MLVPVSWLREFVPFDISSESLAERLTRAGVEVESVQSVGASHPCVVVGQLLAVSSDPERPGVYLLAVDVGTGSPLRTVSRAPNLTDAAIYRYVAVALDGAVILSSDIGGGTQEIRAGTSLGWPSEGAVLSERELGTGDSHEGVLFLPELAPGTPVRVLCSGGLACGQYDVLKLGILPNIARCLGIIGVAGEVAAVTGGRGGPPRVSASLRFDSQEPPTLAPELCRRLSTALVSGIRVGPSPEDIQRRLRLCGLEPINNVVDASNYVMMELGQPAHAYDAARLPSLDLDVRLARPNETLRLLGDEDGQPPARLPPEAVIIVSDEEPVGLAGILGGQDTAVREETTAVLIEAANFHPQAIRRSQAATRRHTNASVRFARGVDPALTVAAIDSFVQLLRRTCPDVTIEWARDRSLGDETLVRTIPVTVEQINASLGTGLSSETCHSIFARLGLDCAITGHGSHLVVKVGSARQDLVGAADLVEEIARIYGYDKIPDSFPADLAPGIGRGRAWVMRETARASMIESGLQEVLTYSMTSIEVEARLLAAESHPKPDLYVRILNPQSVERSVLRRSLLPELFLCVGRNQRHRDDCHIFEIGAVHLPEQSGPAPGLPAQPIRLALAMSGPLVPPNLHDPTVRDAGFYDALRVLQRVFRRMRLGELKLRPAAHPPFQANASAVVMCSGSAIGSIGLVHPLVARAFDLERPVVAAEVHLDAMIDLSGGPALFQEISRFPVSRFDLSFVVPNERPAGDLLEAARVAASPNLVAATVFDVFSGGSIPPGLKAVGLRLTVGDPGHALTHDEVRALSERVSGHITKLFDAELRG
jgi:phenylalanyl-tRNA synthetase beta chain